MAEDVPVVAGLPVPAIFFQALQQMLSGAAINMPLEVVSPATVRCPAGPGDAQASISIGDPTEARALFRWITAPATVVVSGAAGNYDIFACAAAADSYTNTTDSTDRHFTLAAVKEGTTPSGVYSSRRVSTAVWDGTHITRLIPRLGSPLLGMLNTLIPAGLGPLPWSGATAPEAWLIGDGSLFVIANHPGLYDAIGTTYNADYEARVGKAVPAGEAALPDCRGRTMIGPDSMGASGAAGRVAGAVAGAHGGESSHTLVTGETPVIKPTFDLEADFYMSASAGGTVVFCKPSAPGEIGAVPFWGTTLLNPHTFGGGGAHNNMQPYLVVRNWIIKDG